MFADLHTRLERNVAIMAASIPAARPLLQPFLQLTSRRLRKSWSKSSSRHSDERFGSSKENIHSAPQNPYENIELPNVATSPSLGSFSQVLRSQEEMSSVPQDV